MVKTDVVKEHEGWNGAVRIGGGTHEQAQRFAFQVTGGELACRTAKKGGVFGRDLKVAAEEAVRGGFIGSHRRGTAQPEQSDEDFLILITDEEAVAGAFRVRDEEGVFPFLKSADAAEAGDGFGQAEAGFFLGFVETPLQGAHFGVDVSLPLGFLLGERLQVVDLLGENGFVGGGKFGG